MHEHPVVWKMSRWKEGTREVSFPGWLSRLTGFLGDLIHPGCKSIFREEGVGWCDVIQTIVQKWENLAFRDMDI